MKTAFGGVVFNEQGDVLLLEPRNHYGGYVWTFAKGRPNANETDEETALREVRTIEKTTSLAGRKRDLAVLEAACQGFQQYR